MRSAIKQILNTKLGKSPSHFSGRFRRANDLRPTGLGKAELGEAIARWEKFRFNPPPARQQLEALTAVVGVEADRLAQMLPPAGMGMKLIGEASNLPV